MALGDIVRYRGATLNGVVKAIDDWDRVTVAMDGTACEVVFDMCDLEVVKEG